MFSKVPKICDLKEQFVVWEDRKEELEVRRPDLRAAVLEQQEANLAGNPDPKALQAARADLADWEEKIEACAARIVKTKETLSQEVQKELERRSRELPKTKEALKKQQEQALMEVARGLALIDFYQDYFFGPGHLVDAQLVTRDRPGRQEVEDALRQHLATEMARLESAHPDAAAFKAKKKETAELETVWAPPPAKQSGKPLDWVSGGPPMSASREQWVEMQVKALIREARAAGNSSKSRR